MMHTYYILDPKNLAITLIIRAKTDDEALAKISATTLLLLKHGNRILTRKVEQGY